MRGAREEQPVSNVARLGVCPANIPHGARVERINWRADSSARGLAQSAGIMANYRYRLQDIEANHEAYRGAGKIVASAAVRSLLKG